MANILVAGAGKGIGRATADLAYRRSHRVTAVSRSEADLQGRPYETAVLDLEKSESIRQLGPYASAIDAVINCAGTHPGEQEFDEHFEGKVMDIVSRNLLPALHLYQAFLPIFRDRKQGHFIHVSSERLIFLTNQKQVIAHPKPHWKQ